MAIIAETSQKKTKKKLKSIALPYDEYTVPNECGLGLTLIFYN